MNTPSQSLLEEFEVKNEQFEHAMACSFEDLALLHMVRELRPRTEIIFLDTGGHFPETLEFAARIENEWDLHLTRTTPTSEADAWPCGTERCCELRKVQPLARAVNGRSAWITSVKRVCGMRNSVSRRSIRSRRGVTTTSRTTCRRIIFQSIHSGPRATPQSAVRR